MSARANKAPTSRLALALCCLVSLWAAACSRDPEPSSASVPGRPTGNLVVGSVQQGLTSTVTLSASAVGNIRRNYTAALCLLPSYVYSQNAGNTRTGGGATSCGVADVYRSYYTFNLAGVLNANVATPTSATLSTTGGGISGTAGTVTFRSFSGAVGANQTTWDALLSGTSYGSVSMSGTPNPVTLALNATGLTNAQAALGVGNFTIGGSYSSEASNTSALNVTATSTLTLSLTCNSGFGDCNAGTDGCEMNLNAVATCGTTCGTAVACPAPPANSVAVCTAGACGFTCNSGFFKVGAACQAWTTCNPGQYVQAAGTSTTDRVCATCGAGMYSTTSNAASCTQCAAGTASAATGATSSATCASCGTGSYSNAGASSCTACGAGTANCDVNSTCETNTNTDANNCGGCGTVCPSIAGATPTCSAGVCGFSCGAGLADCDGSTANGCETNTNTDFNNCGTCGTSCNDGSACTTDSCAAGTCGHAAITCNDSNVCTVDTCNAATGCVYTPGNAGTVCGTQTGICDAPEVCTGSSATCPANAYAALGSDCGYTGTGYGGFIIYQSGAPGFNTNDTTAGTGTANYSGYSVTNVTSGLPLTWDSNALKFTTTSNASATSLYWKALGGNAGTGNAPRAMAAADFVEYDVYIANSVGGIGGIDLKNSDGTYWRDCNSTTCGTWQDQNAIGGHPAADLSAQAYGKWYHRRLAVPNGPSGPMVGKTISYVDVVDELDGAATVTAYYDNVLVSQIAGACNGNNVCLKKTGYTCTAASECASGFCADGYCCNSACNGSCDVCSAALGASANGTCSPASAATLCTGASQGGVCDNDAADHCSGATTSCVDVFKAAGSSCRTAIDICDVTESCTGTSGACPADGFMPNTTVCRAAVAGGCDVVETCTGSSAACPPDVVIPNGTVCRAAAGSCDVAETCTAGVCPIDAKYTASQLCRPSTGECDAPEYCLGNSCTVGGCNTSGGGCTTSGQGCYCTDNGQCPSGQCIKATGKNDVSCVNCTGAGTPDGFQCAVAAPGIPPTTTVSTTSYACTKGGCNTAGGACSAASQTCYCTADSQCGSGKCVNATGKNNLSCTSCTGSGTADGFGCQLVAPGIPAAPTLNGFGYTPSNFNPASVTPPTTATTISCSLTYSSSTHAFTTAFCAGQTAPTITSNVAQTSGGPTVDILAFNGLTLNSGVTLTLTGANPVVLAVFGNATINGVIDASASGTTPGAGGNNATSCATGPGGNGNGLTGGGGAGLATNGANGGGATNGGAAHGSNVGTPLIGGCAGGSGGASAGAGGGGVQLSASGTLSVAANAIKANGGTGSTGSNGACGILCIGAGNASSGGGGGSAGDIVLEGKTVTSSTVQANGGNGGAGGKGCNVSTAPAGGSGGTNTGSGASSPAGGGAGDNNACGLTSSKSGGGGGGGASGNVKVTSTGAAATTCVNCLCTTTLSPTPVKNAAGTACLCVADSDCATGKCSNVNALCSGTCSGSTTAGTYDSANCQVLPDVATGTVLACSLGGCASGTCTASAQACVCTADAQCGSGKCVKVAGKNDAACGASGCTGSGTMDSTYCQVLTVTLSSAANDCPADQLDAAGTACSDDGLSCTNNTCNGTDGVCHHPVIGGCAIAGACYADGALNPANACQVCNNAANDSAWSNLGNGTVCRAALGVCDVSEVCAGTGAPCPADSYVASGTQCRASLGACDPAEACTGFGVDCPVDSKASNTTACRPAAGACDAVEMCDGVGAGCPADAKLPNTSVCRTAVGVCDVDENCDGTTDVCPADTVAPSTTVCRAAAAGGCDVPESCTGSSPACPSDGFLSAVTVCRAAAAGGCDVAETCPGNGPACPADSFAAAATVCRVAADVCDVAESCTGASVTCPADGFVAAGTSCRGVAGVCDLAESCTGSSASCPADGFATGTSCSDGDPCNGTEQCDGSGAGALACKVVAGSPVVCPPPADTQCQNAGVCSTADGLCHYTNKADGTSCDDGQICTTPDSCNLGVCQGTSSLAGCDDSRSCTIEGCAAGVCSHTPNNGACDDGNPCTVDSCNPAAGGSDVVTGCLHTPGNAGAACRIVAGACDVAEACDGVSAACPADTFVAVGTSCRPSAGACDVAETCTGTAAACPADAVATTAIVCRSATGVCDAAENCDGATVNCPADGFLSSATVCRASAGTCDAAETCSGTAATCPADAFAPNTTVCRAAADVCDVAENCTGLAAACPADVFASNAVTCRPSVDVCDQADTCSGTSATCPVDARVPNGTVCRPPAGGCDVPETCNGVATSCPADGFATSGTICRPAAAICDVNETCSGTAAACPADAFVPVGVSCRAPVGPCDPEESCTGAVATCPPDQLAAAGSACPDDGVICSSDVCNGTSGFCQHPAGNAGTVCNPSLGVCDPEELCDGLVTTCPINVLAPATQVCRAATDICDFPETCTGSTVSCPADIVQPAGTVCTEDGNYCTADVCDGASNSGCLHNQLPLGSVGVPDPPGCGLYVCGATDCLTSCTKDADCISTAYCTSMTGGVCLPKKDNGNACGRIAECKSNLCVDGTCCNTSCTDQCAACNVVGLEGTCSPVAGSPVNGRTACPANGTVCGNQGCNGIDPLTCHYPSTTTACSPPLCGNATQTNPATCNGSGACATPTTTPCPPYACGPTTCLTSCTTDLDCSTGNYCSGSTCVPKNSNGTSCTKCDQCKTGYCNSGGKCAGCVTDANCGATATAGACNTATGVCTLSGTALGTPALYNNWATGYTPYSNQSCVLQVSTTGLWSRNNCGESHAGLCEGPQLQTSGAPVGGQFTDWKNPIGPGPGQATPFAKMTMDGTWDLSTSTATYPSVCAGPNKLGSLPAPPGAMVPVADLASCTGANNEWYYDNNTSPSTLTLCPSACAAVQADPQGALNLTIGCLPTMTPPTAANGQTAAATTVFIEEYDATCPKGNGALWEYLTYATSAPLDSTITFEARTSGTYPMGSADPWTLLAKVDNAVGNEVCSITDACAVNLVNVLTNASLQYLELRITLNVGPSGALPQVNAWKLTHTCEPNQ